MSRITNRGATGPLDLFQTSTDISLETIVGARFDSSDGREFVIVQNAGTALVAGNLIQGPAKIANHQGLVVTAFQAYSANGNTPAKVTATLGGTLTTANQYAGGYLIVASATGIGQTLKIASNTAQSSTTGACVVTLEDSPLVALDTTSTINLIPNPYGSLNGTDYRTEGVIICPTTLTGQVIGVTLYAIPASTATVAQYGYIQTRGLVGCLNDANTAIGLDLMPSANTAGAVQTYVVATKTRIGTSTQAGTTTAVGQITVQL
jgi:hypothetical protein